MADGYVVRRVYSLCAFAPDWVVPEVELIDADTDEEAVALAGCRKFGTRREVWDHHRLVAQIAAK